MMPNLRANGNDAGRLSWRSNRLFISSNCNRLSVCGNAWPAVFVLTAFVLSAICSMSPLFAVAADTANQPDLRFTILHTNDLHAHDDPFVENGKSNGGMARVGHIIRELRSKDGDTVTIDAGDIFQGTPLYNLKHGEVEVNLLNKIGCDIATIGNHEFDDGPINLAAQLQKAKYQIICANMDFSAVPALAKLVKPSVVKVIDGQKVGFIGAMTPEISRGSITLGGVKLNAPPENWTKPIEDEVARLKASGIDKIIIVSHCGVEFDRELAERIPAIDVIVGGHSHTRLDPPIIIDHADGSSTMIVQTGCYGRSVGELKLAFDASGRLVKDQSHERLIDATANEEEDLDLKTYITEQSLPLAVLDREIVGRALGSFNMNFNDYLWDSPIGDLVCEALFDQGRKFGAQIVLQNRGGIRSHIEAGPISAKDAESVLPFDNVLVVATVTGATILNSIENGLSGYLGARFLEVHGIKFAYDRSKPAGKKIVFALALNKAGVWEPIAPSKDYRLAINNYNFKSGEGHDFSHAKEIEFCEQRLSTIFETYLKQQKQIKPEPPERIVPLTAGIKIDAGLSNGKLNVQVSNVQPGAQLTLVVGTGQSVECVADSIPVPLLDSQVVRSKAISTDQGSYNWNIDLTELQSLLSKQHIDRPLSTIVLCVVAQHGAALKDTAISYPVVVSLRAGPR